MATKFDVKTLTKVEHNAVLKVTKVSCVVNTRSNYFATTYGYQIWSKNPWLEWNTLLSQGHAGVIQGQKERLNCWWMPYGNQIWSEESWPEQNALLGSMSIRSQQEARKGNIATKSLMTTSLGNKNPWTQYNTLLLSCKVNKGSTRGELLRPPYAANVVLAHMQLQVFKKYL